MKAGLATLLLLSCQAAVAAPYTGSKVCAGCHAAIYSRYIKTPMGRSLLPASDPALLATVDKPVTVHGAQDRNFEVFRKGADLYQREYFTNFENTYKMEYAIGSGENGRTLIARRGNYLVEAPLTFYSKPAKWDLSPGFELADPGFNRRIPEACLVCHSGRTRAVPGRNGLYESAPFAEASIGCENCHGPGEAHARSSGKSAIVNPAKLPARRTEDICAMCHQGGDARVLQPGKQFGDFRPGEPLIQTLAIFKLPAQRETDLLEHNAAMKLSKCFRVSRGKLSCLTCHDPHASIATAKATYYRERCLTCHTPASCKLPAAARAQDDCAGCHMPKRAVAKISHSALTNHRIVATTAEPLPAEFFAKPTPELPGLLCINGAAANLPLLTRLAAYGELLPKAPELQTHYLDLLNQAARLHPQDPLTLAALGRKAILESRLPEAIASLSAAISDTAPSSTFLDLAQALKLAGRQPESIPVLQRVAVLDPYDPSVRKSLILAHIEAKNYSAAKSLMERYVADFPEDSLMRDLLRKVGTTR